MTNRLDVLEFVARHGVVLASAKGPVPNVADAIAGETIRGSWWGHAKGTEIFDALGAVADSTDVLSFRLVERKVTFVHRRLWPALVRLVDEIGPATLTAIKQEHSKTGAHRNVSIPFPKWAPQETLRIAETLSAADARSHLGSWLVAPTTKAPKRRGDRRGE